MHFLHEVSISFCVSSPYSPLMMLLHLITSDVMPDSASVYVNLSFPYSISVLAWNHTTVPTNPHRALTAAMESP